MPKFEFQVPKLSGDINKDIKGLFNAYIDMSQNFQWLLTNLNETNVKRAKSVVADWVYAGEVKTDQLVAGEAKISTALIDELIVGDNVVMGPDASISWGQVTDQPYIPPEYTDEDALNAIESTYIDEHGVWTPNVYATNINVSKGKITTAQIEDLVVGGNVTMGPDATISWSNVTSKPSIPPEYTDADAIAAINSTYIDAYGVWTPQVYAENIAGTYITGKTLRTAASGKRLQINSDGLYTYNSSGSIDGITLSSSDQFRELRFYDSGYLHGSLFLDDSNHVITLRSISGYNLELNADWYCEIIAGNDISLMPNGKAEYYDGSSDYEIATRGWVGSHYVKDAWGQGIEMQIFDDRIEFRKTGETWKTVYFA